MEGEVIPAIVREFVMRHIDSVAQLEALLLVRGNPVERWDIHKTARRLYTSEQEVADLLKRLCEDGLLRVSKGIYRYDPASPELKIVVSQLADCYSRHLIPVTSIIHSKPRRIREFADAFKFRKDR